MGLDALVENLKELQEWSLLWFEIHEESFVKTM